MSITYQRNLAGIDWTAMKAVLSQDSFDNGRTPTQLEASFANSFATCIARDGAQIIGTARVLSDGVCNAYIVDVWTYSPYRHHGIGRRMMEMLLQELPGQHVYLFTDDVVDFYRKVGFAERHVGMEKVVGEWLKLERPETKSVSEH